MNDPKIDFQAKPLSEFKPGESLCGQKTIRGYTYTFQGQIVRFGRGSVVIRGSYLTQYAADRVDTRIQEVAFRFDKCFVWGRGPDDTHDRCHWFRLGKNFPPL